MCTGVFVCDITSGWNLHRAVNAGYKERMETKEKRPVGRPRYAPENVRTCEVSLRVTAEEKDTIRAVAARREMPVNVYLRALIAADIARETEPA